MSSDSAEFRYPTTADARQLEQSSSGLPPDRVRERSGYIQLRREAFHSLNIAYGDLEFLAILYWNAGDIVEPANDRLQTLYDALGSEDKLLPEFERLRDAVRQKWVLSAEGQHQDASIGEALKAWLACRSSLVEAIESARRLVRQPKEARTEDLDEAAQAVWDGLSSVVNGLMDLQRSCHEGVNKQLRTIRTNLDKIEGNIEEYDMRSAATLTQDKDVPRPSESFVGGTENRAARDSSELATTTPEAFTQPQDFSGRAGN